MLTRAAEEEGAISPKRSEILCWMDRPNWQSINEKIEKKCLINQ